MLPSPRPRQADRWLFVFSLALFLLTSGGHTTSPDEEERYYVTRGLVEQQRLAVTLPPAGVANLASQLVVEGRRPDGTLGPVRYSKYGIGGSLVQLPFYLLGLGMVQLTGTTHVELVTRAALALTNPLATAAALVVMAALARRLGATVAQAVGLALLTGFGTPLWVHAKSMFVEPLVALALLLAAWALVRWHQDRWQPGPWIAGAALGLCLLLRLDSLVVFPAFGLYLLFSLAARRRSGGEGRDSVAAGDWFRAIAAISTGPLLAVALIAAYNAARFGSALETGYGSEAQAFNTPLALGLYGLLFSPGRGLLLYAPPVLLACLGAGALIRRFPREAGMVGLVGLLSLAFFARWSSWEGGAGWGPRLLLPAVPVVMLFAIPLLAACKGSLSRGRVWGARLLVTATVVIAAWVQPAGVLIQFLAPLDSGLAPSQEHLLFDRNSSPVRLHWRLFGETWTYWSDLRARRNTDAVVLEGLDIAPHARTGSALPAWTAPRLRLRIFDVTDRAAAGGQPQLITLVYDEYRPAAQKVAIPRPGVAEDAAFAVPAAWIEGQSRTPLVLGQRGSRFLIELGMDKSGVAADDSATFVLEVPAWNEPPKPWDPAARPRGIHLAAVEVDGQELAAVKVRTPPPPLDAWSLFGWFYRPEYHQFDLWWWFALIGGFPRLPTIALAGLLAALTVVAAINLARSVRGTAD